MRKTYDFSKSVKNPYAGRMKKQITIRLDEETVDYFKTMAEAKGIPYQSLINLVPGATPGVQQNSLLGAPARALSTNINGTNRNNNITRVDGAVNLYLWLPHHTAYVAPAETVETVSIATNNFDADTDMHYKRLFSRIVNYADGRKVA